MSQSLNSNKEMLLVLNEIGETISSFSQNSTDETSEQVPHSFFQIPQFEEPFENLDIPDLNSPQYPVSLYSTEHVLLWRWYTPDSHPQPSSPLKFFPGLVVKGDLPDVKRSESNILITSKELVERSFFETKEGLHASFANEDCKTTETLETKVLKIVKPEETFPITNTDFEDEGDEDKLPLLWKIKRWMVPISSKGKGKRAD